MTNAEKFEEVFGIKIDDYPSNICTIADHKICNNANNCHECEIFKFWDREYIDKTVEDHEEISKAFLFGVFFGYVANSDVTLSMITEELEKLGVREDD